MVPMHQDLSFSSVVSEIVPSAHRSGFRTPCCRGRSACTSSRIPGRIGDIAPDSFDLTFLQQSLKCVETEIFHNQHDGTSTCGNDSIPLHSLEIDIVQTAHSPLLLYNTSLTLL
jgi:hypothetical protein